MKNIGFKGAVTIIAVILSAAFGGCGNLGAETEREAGGIIPFPENITLSFDKTKVFPESCNIYTAVTKSFSEEDFKGLFVGTPVKKTELKRFTLELDNQHGYGLKNTMGFYTDDGNQFDNAVSFFTENPDNLYMDDISELSFEGRHESFLRVCDFLNGIGIPSEKIIIKSFYSVKKAGYDFFKQSLSDSALNTYGEDKEKAQRRADKAGKTESADFYYLELEFKIDDIPVISDRLSMYGENMDDSIFGSGCSAVYTDKGIEFFNLHHFYEPMGEGQAAEILSFEAAQQLAAKKYDEIFFDGEIEIYDVKLIYVPIPQNDFEQMNSEFLLEPCYVFYCSQQEYDEEGAYTSDFSLFFDAVTGKELGTVR